MRHNKKVTNVVIPNGLQIGIEGDTNFESGLTLNGPITFTSTTAPTDTTAKLYVIGTEIRGTLSYALYFNGSEVGSGGGSDSGWTDDGAVVRLTTSTDKVGIGTTSPKTALSVMNDYSSFPADITSGQGGGEIIKVGTGTLTAGYMYYLHSDNSWKTTDASSTTNGASQLLGIALGTSPTSDGVLVRGFAYIPYGNFDVSGSPGYPVYLSTTTNKFAYTAPASSGNIVRVVGYAVSIDGSSADTILYFNPDSTYVEIS